MIFMTQEIDHRLNNMRDGSEACVAPECPAPAPPAPIGYSKDGSKESKEVAPPPPPPSEKVFDVWAAANTVFAELEGRNEDLTDQKFSTWGFILGADLRINENWIAGAFVNYDRIWASLDKDGSTANIDSGGGGLYAGYQNGGWYRPGLFDHPPRWDDPPRNITVPVDFVFRDTYLSI